MTPRRLAVAAALAAAALALVALALLRSSNGGSGPASLSSVEDVERAAAATARVPSGRFGFVLDQALPNGEAVTVTGYGAFDARARRSKVSLDLSALGSLLDAFAPEDSQASKLLENGSLWRLDAVHDGTDLYLRFPILQKRPGWASGKTWVKMDLRRLGAERRTLRRLQEYGSSDARALLPCLRAASGGLVRVGDEQLHGARVVHYRVPIDVQRYRRLERRERAYQRASLPIELLAGSHARRVPVDVWIDGAGLVRKFELTFPSSSPDTQGPVRASVRFEFYDFGTKVPLPLPPAAAVVGSAHVTV